MIQSVELLTSAMANGSLLAVSSNSLTVSTVDLSFSSAGGFLEAPPTGGAIVRIRGRNFGREVLALADSQGRETGKVQCVFLSHIDPPPSWTPTNGARPTPVCDGAETYMGEGEAYTNMTDSSSPSPQSVMWSHTVVEMTIPKGVGYRTVLLAARGGAMAGLEPQPESFTPSGVVIPGWNDPATTPALVPRSVPLRFAPPQLSGLTYYVPTGEASGNEVGEDALTRMSAAHTRGSKVVLLGQGFGPSSELDALTNAEIEDVFQELARPRSLPLGAQHRAPMDHVRVLVGGGCRTDSTEWSATSVDVTRDSVDGLVPAHWAAEDEVIQEVRSCLPRGVEERTDASMRVILPPGVGASKQVVVEVVRAAPLRLRASLVVSTMQAPALSSVAAGAMSTVTYEYRDPEPTRVDPGYMFITNSAQMGGDSEPEDLVVFGRYLGRFEDERSVRRPANGSF